MIYSSSADNILISDRDWKCANYWTPSSPLVVWSIHT